MKRIILIVLIAVLGISAYSQNGNKGVFDNAVYARLAYGMPGGELKTIGAVTAGGQFEVGTIFYLQKLTLPEKLKLGIDVTYLSISGVFNKKSSQDNNKTDSYFMAGAKVGPCVSYNFADEWIGDVYFKLYPHSFIAGETENHFYNAENQFKLGTSFGLNVRYKALMVGCEFTNAKYDFTITAPAKVASGKTSVKLPVTFLSLGVNF